MFNKKSEIIFIGAGKVAHSLIPPFIEKNYSVKGIVSRNLKSSRLLAKKYKLEFFADEVSLIPPYFKIFFLTIPDNEIVFTAEKLSRQNLSFKDSLFVHTSGSESSDALKSLKRKGGTTASFHIMQTFPSSKIIDIRNSFCAIETDDQAAEKFLFSLAQKFGLKGLTLSKENKVYYHLAGVFSANFLNANFYSSEELILKAGLSKKNNYKLFEPIVTATLHNIKNSGVENSLSGPVQRGDSLTIKKHIDALRRLDKKMKGPLLQSYISQSLILLEVIKKQKKILTSGQKLVKKILEEGLENSKKD